MGSYESSKELDMPEPVRVEKENKPLSTIERSIIESEVVEQVRQVYDPEIPVNVYDLGLIYDVKCDEEGRVHIVMTLTSPACPVAESLPIDVENAARSAQGVKDVRVELTWDPPFTLEMMSDDVKLMLGLL